MSEPLTVYKVLLGDELAVLERAMLSDTPHTHIVAQPSVTTHT